MRKLLLVFALFCTTAFAGIDLAPGQGFDQGYEIGFEQGWKHVRGSYSVAPIAPIAPIPKIGFDDFFGGYDEGFLAGMARASAGGR